MTDASSPRIYHLEEIPGGFRIVHLNGLMLFELRGGNYLVIGMTFANLQSRDPRRADDYITGVLAGLTHCFMTQTVPAVEVGYQNLGS